MNIPKTYCARLFVVALLSVSLTTALAMEKKKTKSPKETQEQTTEAVANGEPILKEAVQMPTFRGGNTALINYFITNLKYPQGARAANAQGRVFVNFVVEKDGSVSNVELTRGVHPLLDMEAVRLVRSMPKWIPGKQDGKLVRVSYTIPINFHLQ
jgi:protein TonB